MDISILIPTHNRADILDKTLSSLRHVTVPADTTVELIIVPNACTDHTTDIATQHSRLLSFPVRIIEDPIPGLSQARNTCCKEAQGAILAFLDDDVLLAPDWLEGLQRSFNEHQPDICGGKVELWWDAVDRPDWLDPRDESFLSRNDRGPNPITLTSPVGIIGANFAFTHQAWEAIGLFNTNLGRKGSQTLSYEESDWIDRGLKAGLKAWYSPHFRLKHWVAPQRASIGYLTKISRDNAISRIMAKKNYGIKGFLRSLLGHGSLFLINLAKANLSRSQSLRSHYRIALANNIGGITGAFMRATSGSPSDD